MENKQSIADGTARETKTELKYEYWGEIKRCDACNEWIENKLCRINRNGNILYFHPFCFYCLTNKNPLYKSLNNNSINNIYQYLFDYDARLK